MKPVAIKLLCNEMSNKSVQMNGELSLKNAKSMSFQVFWKTMSINISMYHDVMIVEDEKTQY